MKHHKSEKGQAIIIITLAIIGLVALTGLAVDGSMAYADRRRAQNSADSAAYAAALAVVKSKDPQAAAQSAASTNGGSSTVVVTTSPAPSGACPSGADGTDIKVDVTTKVKASFGLMVGVKEITNKVTATTRECDGVTSTSSGGLFSGSGMVATSLTDLNYSMGGSGKIINHGGGLFSNSTRQPSVVLSGDPRVCLDPGYTISVPAASGGTSICNWCSGGCPAGMATGLPAVTNSVPQFTQEQIDAFLATIPAPPTPPTCTGNGAITGANCWSTSCAAQVVTPGNYPSGLTLDGGKYFTIQSGTYCFNGTGGFVSSGGAHFTHNPATTDVVFVGSGTNGVDMQGGTDAWKFRNLEIYTVNGNWHVGGGVNLYADRLRFISSGTGNNVVDGSSFIKNLAGTGAVPDAFLYFKAGKPSWDAGANIALHAPSSDPFKGLLVYLPWSNSSALTFAGGTGYSLTGTYLAPHSAITITGGNSSTVVNSQIIGYKYVVDGGAVLNLNYGATDNYGVPGSPTNPTISLLK